MESVVITGGGGFVGSRLCAFLKQKGLKVKVVDIKFPQERYEWWSQADMIECLDLRDYAKMERAVYGADIVFHLAADMGGVGFFTANDYLPFFNNMRMSLNVLEACEKMGVKKLFFSSSACIYPINLQEDTANAPLLSEDKIFPANADQMYGWEKLMTTMLCKRSSLDTRVGIFHTIFGEGQEIVGDRVKFPPAIIAKVLESKKTGNPIKIWGDGTQMRTFLYVEDALNMIWKLVNMPKDQYKGEVNIANPELISVKDAAVMACEIAGIEPNLEFEPDKPSGVMARGVDLTKLHSYFDYDYQYTMRDGFTRLYHWLEAK